MEPMLKGTVTVKTVVARCKQLGVMLCDDGGTLRADLPRYKVFKGRTQHYLDFAYSKRRWGLSREDALGVLLEDLAEGLEDCTDPECECCVTEFLSFEDIVTLYKTKRLA